ncbi:MAG: phosphotransferase [Halioglobus sp.]
MAKTLSQSARQRLALTLAQWRHWQAPFPLESAPQIRRQLDEGISNTSIQVATEDQVFVVRLDGVDTRSHNLNRPVEWKTLLEASGRKLAPLPVYLNPELGVLVCEYLPSDENQQQTETDVADLLNRIHSLPAIHHRIDLSQRIRQYLHQLETRQPGISNRLSTVTDLTARILQKAGEEDAPLVVCHNDLHAANRLRSNGTLYALDWEYSGMGHRWFDLAVICECDPDAIEADALLSAYLARGSTAQERELLIRFRLCYRYLSWLWYAVRNQNPVRDSDLTALVSTLTPALAETLKA